MVLRLPDILSELGFKVIFILLDQIKSYDLAEDASNGGVLKGFSSGNVPTTL